MRPLAGLIGLGLALAAASAVAEPAAAPGYTLEAVRREGAVFAGLARDGDALLLTNLADGRLYRRTPDGEFTAFGPELPHGIDVIGDPTGPYRVERLGESYLVAQGWTPAGTGEGELDHTLFTLDPDGGITVIEADFWNPFDFAVAGDLVYVVDAARNSIERLRTDGRARRTLVTFPRLSQGEAALKPLSPTEFANGKEYEFDAVPTGIALDGGRVYVSLFGGFPFLEGSGRIVSLTEGEAPSLQTEVETLNAPVDVAFEADRSMLVLEHGSYDQAAGFLPGTGRLISIGRSSGERREVLTGLTRPAAVLVFDERTIVVSQLDGTLLFLRRTAP